MTESKERKYQEVAKKARIKIQQNLMIVESLIRIINSGFVGKEEADKSLKVARKILSEVAKEILGKQDNE